MVCEAVTSPTAAKQILELDDDTARLVLDAIGRREAAPFAPKGRTIDPEGSPNAFLDLTVRGVAIRCLMMDNGAAFEVLSVRRYFIG